MKKIVMISFLATVGSWVVSSEGLASLEGAISLHDDEHQDESKTVIEDTGMRITPDGQVYNAWDTYGCIPRPTTAPEQLEEFTKKEIAEAWAHHRLQQQKDAETMALAKLQEANKVQRKDDKVDGDQFFIPIAIGCMAGAAIGCCGIMYTYFIGTSLGE